MLKRAISNIIALGESWAEHIGQFFNDLRYGVVNSSIKVAQGNSYFNNFPVVDLSSHLNLLEDYNPNLITDNTRWIPYGLYYDLFDVRNETGVPIIDNFAGMTNQQMFNALETDISSLPLYRQRLILQTGANAANVNLLFNEYHY